MTANLNTQHLFYFNLWLGKLLLF